MEGDENTILLEERGVGYTERGSSWNKNVKCLPFFYTENFRGFWDAASFLFEKIKEKKDFNSRCSYTQMAAIPSGLFKHPKACL